MPSEFFEGKKIAIGILKKILIAQRDTEPTDEMLAQFYQILHGLLVNRKYVNTLYHLIPIACCLMKLLTG